jgi:hypothetical protein
MPSPRRAQYWSTLAVPCTAPRPRPTPVPSRAATIRSPGGAAQRYDGPPMTWPTCSRRPVRSWRKPGTGWPAEHRMGEPAGQPARRRRPADRQGPARTTGRVRLQGPSRRHRRRADRRLHPRPGQPARRATARPRHRPGDHPHRPHPPHRDRRPRLRRSVGQPSPARPGRDPTSSSPAKADPARPAECWNTADHSGEP